MKKLRFLFIVGLLLSLVLTGCSRLLVSWDPEDFDSTGKRIGVGVAEEADYALTPRRDIKLYRYDTTAEAITALVYGNIDAVCVDNAIASYSMENIVGLSTVPSELKDTSYSVIFSRENATLCEEFNEFLSTFKESEAWKSYQDNINQTTVRPDTDFPAVPLTGGGRELVVSVDIEEYPFSYVLAGKEEPLGFDHLILNEFANAYNYRLKLIKGNYESCQLSVSYGTSDMAIGCFSNYYKEELLDMGILVSDPYLGVNLKYIIVTDGKNLGNK